MQLGYCVRGSPPDLLSVLALGRGYTEQVTRRGPHESSLSKRRLAARRRVRGHRAWPTASTLEHGDGPQEGGGALWLLPCFLDVGLLFPCPLPLSSSPSSLSRGARRRLGRRHAEESFRSQISKGTNLGKGTTLHNAQSPATRSTTLTTAAASSAPIAAVPAAAATAAAAEFEPSAEDNCRD
jgi:hypothetical protein